MFAFLRHSDFPQKSESFFFNLLGDLTYLNKQSPYLFLSEVTFRTLSTKTYLPLPLS